MVLHLVSMIGHADSAERASVCLVGAPRARGLQSGGVVGACRYGTPRIGPGLRPKRPWAYCAYQQYEGGFEVGT